MTDPLVLGGFLVGFVGGYWLAGWIHRRRQRKWAKAHFDGIEMWQPPDEAKPS